MNKVEYMLQNGFVNLPAGPESIKINIFVNSSIVPEFVKIPHVFVLV